MTEMPNDAPEAERSLLRLSTGSPQLDDVLGGGFPANSINILMGEPGSGKTILAERLMFANAEEGGRPILFFTTLSEPLDKVMRYLQQFRFYDETKLTGSIVYDSIGTELAANGVSMLVPHLKNAIITQKPKVIVIDSFKAVHDLSTSITEMRRMLHELAGLLTAYEATAFFVGEYCAAQMADYPEFAVADGVVELARNKLGNRDERFLRVLKLRGSGYMEGLHAFRITPDGLEVYPRLVSPVLAPSYELLEDRLPTGVRGLDTILRGGISRGRSTFVVGPTGSGKTTLALQFVLEGVRQGEPCMYVSFEENPTQLDMQIASLGLAGRNESFAKGLSCFYVSPVELQIDSIVTTILRTIREKNIRRLVVDAVGDLLVAANDRQRLHDYLYALAQHFAVMGVTSIFTYEATSVSQDIESRMSALADNVLLLGVQLDGGRARRVLRVVKARGVDHDMDVHELRITNKGVEVA